MMKFITDSLTYSNLLSCPCAGGVEAVTRHRYSRATATDGHVEKNNTEKGNEERFMEQNHREVELCSCLEERNVIFN